MSMIHRGVRILALLLSLTGCAEVPTRLEYKPEQSVTGAQAPVWPPLPEVPRYTYVGQLLGEQNIAHEHASQPRFGERVLRWVVGLGAAFRPDPLVLVRPQSGMVDTFGRILVTDVGRSAVFVFDPQAGRMSVWSSADEGYAFATPVGIAPGAEGEVLVVDAELRRVVRLSDQGKPLGSFGTGLLQRPTGLARDPGSGLVFVVDTGAHDLKVFDSAGLLVDRIGSHGDAAGQFNAPTHVAFAHGRLYVTDTLNARVQILEADGASLGSIGRRGLYLGNLTRPKGVTVDADGNVYVIESYYDHLLVFNGNGEFLLPLGGTGNGIGQFYLPAGVWSDRGGRIFVADMYNGRVVIFQYLGV